MCGSVSDVCIFLNIRSLAYETSKVLGECDNFFTGSDRMFVSIFIRVKIAFEGKLDLLQPIFVVQIFEFTKSLNLASN